MNDYYIPASSLATAVLDMPAACGVASRRADMSPLTSADTLAEIHCIPGFGVLQPVPFQAERICGEFVLTDSVFGRYGNSTDFSEAKAELVRALADYFETLKAEEHRLSRGARVHYEAMLRHVAV